MICKCGNILSTVEAPNDVQLRVYTDKKWDEIMNEEVLIPWKIPLPEYDVWMCPECKRVYVFEDGNNIPVMKYVLESD